MEKISYMSAFFPENTLAYYVYIHSTKNKKFFLGSSREFSCVAY